MKFGKIVSCLLAGAVSFSMLSVLTFAEDKELEITEPNLTYALDFPQCPWVCGKGEQKSEFRLTVEELKNYEAIRFVIDTDVVYPGGKMGVTFKACLEGTTPGTSFGDDLVAKTIIHQEYCGWAGPTAKPSITHEMLADGNTIIFDVMTSEILNDYELPEGTDALYLLGYTIDYNDYYDVLDEQDLDPADYEYNNVVRSVTLMETYTPHESAKPVPIESEEPAEEVTDAPETSAPETSAPETSTSEITTTSNAISTNDTGDTDDSSDNTVLIIVIVAVVVVAGVVCRIVISRRKK